MVNQKYRRRIDRKKPYYIIYTERTTLRIIVLEYSYRTYNLNYVKDAFSTVITCNSVNEKYGRRIDRKTIPYYPYKTYTFLISILCFKQHIGNIFYAISNQVHVEQLVKHRLLARTTRICSQVRVEMIKAVFCFT